MLGRLAGRLPQRVSAQLAAAVSAQSRGFAETAVATEQINFDELASNVYSDNGKREVQTLRSAYLDITQKLSQMKQDPPPINFDEWKKETDPKLVDMFQKAFVGMPTPKLDTTDEVAKVDQEFAAIVKQADELASHSEKRIKELKAELESVQAEKDKITKITVDELLASDPAAAKAIDEDIRKGDFLP